MEHSHISTIEKNPRDIGWIEVICGGMYSGKTEELIRRIRRAVYAKQKVQVFKPRIDNRFDAKDVVSHSEVRVEGIPVDRAEDILALLEEGVSVVGVDEIQFFNPEIVDIVNGLADRGIRVICAGLDQDYLGKPFEPMPQLLAIAEYITKQLAICMKCGNAASRTQRIVDNDERVVVGAGGQYEARCRRCHVKENLS